MLGAPIQLNTSFIADFAWCTTCPAHQSLLRRLQGWEHFVPVCRFLRRARSPPPAMTERLTIGAA
jgi:hypothetical protein